MPGVKTFKSGYGTGESVMVEVEAKARLGKKYNQFDNIIIAKGEAYNIPPDLLKSLIHQEALKKHDEELGQDIFVANSYRYEAHRDYDWYSRQSPSVPPKIGWRGLAHYPEKHFAIGGYVVTGELIPQGDQVPADYCLWSVHTSGGKLEFPDNKCEGVTAAELVALNPEQNWSDRDDWNFTAQLVLAASYGLGQTMYETAVNRGFDTRDDNGQPARSVKQLFDPKVSIELAASYLKKMYDDHGNNWGDALFAYNGAYESSDPEKYDSWDYADAIMRFWNNGNGTYYKFIP